MIHLPVRQVDQWLLVYQAVLILMRSNTLQTTRDTRRHGTNHRYFEIKRL